MARGKTLLALLDDLRAECRISLNASHNTQMRDTQIKHIQRTQEWLYDDFNWPHLRIRREFEVSAGQRYYDFDADIPVDRIEKIQFKSDGAWRDLWNGIGPEHYQAFDSDQDNRAYPPRRWQIYENDDIEIWPISDVNENAVTGDGYFRVIGIKRLPPLVANDDLAVIDDRLITLYASGEYLSTTNEALSSTKLKMAQSRYMKMRSGLMPRQRFSMFGVKSDDRPGRPYITNYRAPA